MVCLCEFILGGRTPAIPALAVPSSSRFRKAIGGRVWNFGCVYVYVCALKRSIVRQNVSVAGFALHFLPPGSSSGMRPSWVDDDDGRRMRPEEVALWDVCLCVSVPQGPSLLVRR